MRRRHPRQVVDPEAYVPTKMELARKIVVISPKAISILEECRELIKQERPDQQVGGRLGKAAEKIGRIKVSGAYYYEGYIRRSMWLQRGEDWPASAALVFIETMIQHFNNVKQGQLGNVLG